MIPIVAYAFSHGFRVKLMRTGCWPHNHEPRNFAEAVYRNAREVSPASIGGIYASNATGTVMLVGGSAS